MRSAFLLVDAGDSYTRRGARGVSDLAELASLRVDDGGHIASGVVVSIGARAGNARSVIEIREERASSASAVVIICAASGGGVLASTAVWSSHCALGHTRLVVDLGERDAC